MRLKEDSSSYRASGVIARDARHAPDGPDAPRAVRGKRNRKRWCGGKEGREHTPKCMNYTDAKRPHVINEKHASSLSAWKLLVCTTCGKELDRYWPWRQPGESGYEPPPEWAR